MWHVSLRGILCIKKPQTKLFQLLNRDANQFPCYHPGFEGKQTNKQKRTRQRKERKRGRKHKARHTEGETEREGKETEKRKHRSKRIPYEKGVCKGQKEMVFHDVTHSMSVSGKVLEKADMDFFHSSNANYFCHVFKPCSSSKEYRVCSMKGDNLDIYSLPPTRFEQADSLCPTISSLPFKTQFFLFPPTS